MLHDGLVVFIFVLGRLQKCGIEDLFLDGGVHGQRIADMVCQQLLSRLAGGFELREPVLDLTVIGFEQCDRITMLPP